MIEAIKGIGEYVLKKENKPLTEIFSDKVKLSKTKKVLCIVLRKNQKNEYIYKNPISVEDYSYDKPILYRGRAPNGPDFLPSSIITKDVVKTFENKILKWFKEKEGEEINKMREALERDRENIKEDLKTAYSSLHKDEKINVLLTLKISENGYEKHLGEIGLFKNILVEDVVKRYHFLKTIGESKGKGYCYLCNSYKDVNGFVMPAFGFSFATADKPGFTPNFVQRDKWKDIPICNDCAIFLEEGKRFLDENLCFPKKSENFLGCRYYVIPKFIFGEMFDEFYKWIEYFKDKEYEKGLLSREDWLENNLKEKEDVLRLIFVFYTLKVGGKYVEIVQYAEDVLPSWLRKIYDSQKKIREMELFQEESIKKIFGKNWEGDFVKGRIRRDRGLGENNWHVVFLRDFFPYTKTHGVYNKEFREIVGAILSGKMVNKDLLFSAFTREIRQRAKENETYNLQILCVKSFMLYLFLKEINLIKEDIKGDKMDIELNEKKGLGEKIGTFFEKYEINDPEKRAAFCVGMLTDYLLSVQRTERRCGFGEEPFWGKLYGLMLDEKKIKNIFKEAIAKLRQYRKGYPTLEGIVGEYLAKVERKWNLSKEEISYYFALGMVLGRIFKPEKEDKNGRR